MSLLRISAVVCAAVLLFSCRSARKMQNVIVPRDSAYVVKIDSSANAHADSMAHIAEVYSRLQKNKIDFNTFSAKIKVDFTSADGKKNEVNAFVRIKKDSIIWVTINATLINLEVFRLMITPDSVKVLDKQNKQVKLRSLSFLQEVTNIPFDFKTVQDVLIGNPVFLDSSIVGYSKAPGTESLLYLGDWFRNLVTLSADNALILSSKLDDLNAGRNRTCALTYGSYEQKEGRFFSTFRNLTLAEKSKIDIRLDYKQYSFNEPLSFPFSIPRNYSRN